MEMLRISPLKLGRKVALLLFNRETRSVSAFIAPAGRTSRREARITPPSGGHHRPEGPHHLFKCSCSIASSSSRSSRIADYFGVTADFLLGRRPPEGLSHEEEELVRLYRALSAQGKRLLRSIGEHSPSAAWAGRKSMTETPRKFVFFRGVSLFLLTFQNGRRLPSDTR